MVDDLPPSLRPPGGAPTASPTTRRFPTPAPADRPRRRIPLRVTMTVFLLLCAGLALLLASYLLPASLATVHEHIVGWTRGGIVLHSEETFVDGCVSVPGATAPQAITRTIRTTEYGDGTSLQVIFSSAPRPTNACR